MAPSRSAGGIRVVRTRRGARLVQDDAIISDVRDRPGPTHGLFDLLAATLASTGSGSRSLMLGFAAGGVVAPLRALDRGGRFEAVERDTGQVALFRELCGAWAGAVTVHHDEATRWLRRTRRRFDRVLDDLSVPGDEGVTKPEASLDVLPKLVRSRLRRGGVAIVNLLPVPGCTWDELVRAVGAGHARTLVVRLEGYDNRVVIAGEIPDARTMGRQLRSALRRIRSHAALHLHVRTAA